MPLPSSPRDRPTITGSFRILTVCTGNICRSPLAEALLRRELAPFLPDGALQVASAGSIGLSDAAMDPAAIAEARRLGVDTTAHRGRRMSSTAVSGAHLVLGMTREHRAKALDIDPTANRRSFTLVELAAILEVLERPTVGADAPIADRLAAIVDDASTHRGEVTSSLGSALDIEDPYQRSAEVHRRVADEIERAVSGVARDLRRLVG